MRSRKGQVAVEMAAAIIAVFIFFLGLLQVFVWLSSMLVQRQEYYESSRNEAASYVGRGVYNFTPTRLNIFATGGN